MTDRKAATQRLLIAETGALGLLELRETQQQVLVGLPLLRQLR